MARRRSLPRFSRADRGLLHLLVEDLEPVASELLGPVHRRVGVAQQHVRRRTVADGEAEAGREEHLAAVVEDERLGQHLVEPVGDREHRALAGHVLGEDHELVATEAGDGVVGPHDGAQPLGEADEQLVAGPVAEAVVDDLEPVEVEEEDRDLLLQLPGPHQRVLEPVEHQGAVGQSGQVVVHGLVGQAALGFVALERDLEQLARRADRVLLVRVGLARLGVVHRDRAELPAAVGHVEHRQRPGGPEPGRLEGGAHRRHQGIGAGVGHDDRRTRAQRLAVDVGTVGHADAEVLQHPGGQVASAAGDQPLALDQEHADHAVARRGR